MAKGYTRVGDAAAAEYHSFVDLIAVQLCSKVKLYRWGAGKIVEYFTDDARS